MEEYRPDHDYFCLRAARWLEFSRGCGIVSIKGSVCTEEQPDAIGWKHGGRISHLVECKVSRGDFLRDCQKPFRQFPNLGVGLYRWYLTPPKMIMESEIPNGWGLLWLFPDKVKRVKEAVPFSESRNLIAELALVFSLFRRGGDRMYWSNAEEVTA